ncbi:MAG TPA: hypothetical protein VMD76_14190 [Candidatus Sulfotelmatobacter sp.]|nr:hypothetical protein [Candidatus Sulfotelmatobacter sp.]
MHIAAAGPGAIFVDDDFAAGLCEGQRSYSEQDEDLESKSAIYGHESCVSQNPRLQSKGQTEE